MYIKIASVCFYVQKKFQKDIDSTMNSSHLWDDIPRENTFYFIHFKFLGYFTIISFLFIKKKGKIL